jgi:phospholipid/cholesterol/gamma-HCH transport system substrate-binding protein
MENRAHAVAAGAFTLLLLAALAGAIVWLTGDARGGRRIDLVSRGAVSGLNARAAVRLRGVDVGQVQRIGFDPEDARRILVRVSVDSDTPLTRGTYARLTYQGVTGLAYVELDDDGSSREPLISPPGSTVPRIELKRSRLDQIGDSGQLLLSEAAETAQRLNQLLSDQNLAQLSRTFENVEVASRKVAALADTLQPAANALPPLAAHVDKLLTHADALLDHGNTLLAHADSAVQQAGPVLSGLGELTQAAQQRLDVLDRVGRDADRIGDAAEALQRSLVTETLPRVDEVMDDVARNSRSLDRLITSLHDQPQSILFGRAPAPPDPGEPGFRAH